MSGALADGVTAVVAACENEAAGREGARLSEADLVAVMTAAARVYARRLEAAEMLGPPVDVGSLSTTDALNTACEIIRATNANMFDVSMWFSRRGE